MTLQNIGRFVIDRNLLAANLDFYRVFFRWLDGIPVDVDVQYTTNEISFVMLSDKFEKTHMSEAPPDYVLMIEDVKPEDREEMISKIKEDPDSIADRFFVIKDDEVDNYTITPLGDCLIPFGGNNNGS